MRLCFGPRLLTKSNAISARSQVVNLVHTNAVFKRSLVIGDVVAYNLLADRLTNAGDAGDVKSQCVWHVYAVLNNTALTPGLFDSIGLVDVDVAGAVAAAVAPTSLPVCKSYRVMQPSTVHSHLRFVNEQRARHKPQSFTRKCFFSYAFVLFFSFGCLPLV